MAKINLNNITNPQSVSVMNANFQKIAVALDEQVLYRDNIVDEPNQMENDLDMNGKRIYNLPVPVAEHEPMRKADAELIVTEFSQPVIDAANAATIAANAATEAAENAQEAADDAIAQLSAIQGDVDGAVATANSALSATNALSSGLAANTGSSLIGYQRVASGGVPRTLKQKLDDSVNVKDFGAVGDGVTDDSSSLQLAINYAAANKFRLEIPNGTYIVSVPLNLPTNTWIYGVGTIKLKNNNLPRIGDILLCNTQTNITVEGITLDGNRQNNVDHGSPVSGNQPQNWQGTLLAVIDFAYVSNYRIEGVKVVESWGSGIWLTDCTDGVVSNNYIKNHRITGIAIRNNTADIREVKNIRIVGNYVDGGIVGIHCIFGAKDIVINNNVCVNNNDKNRFPAYAYSGTYPNVWPSTGGFLAFGAGGYASPAFQGDGAGIEATGVFTDPSGTANLSNTISGNTCNYNAVGIRLEETSNKFAISGNTCRLNDFHGVLLLSAYFNTVTGNTCTQNGIDGIRLEKVASKPQSANNIISANIVTDNGRYGVVVVGSQGNSITQNNISGNGGNLTYPESGAIGLYLSDSVPIVDTIISDNQLQNTYSTDKYGIYSNSVSNVGNSISGNFFSGAYQVGKTLNLSNVTNTFFKNRNLPTESKGTATITAGSLFIDVAHGLAFPPVTGSVSVSPVGDPGVSRWWLQSADATNIRIQINAALAGSLTFVWNVT